MSRKIFYDIVKRKILSRDIKWVVRRAFQYILIAASYALKKPLTGPVLGSIIVTYDCNSNCQTCNIKERHKELNKKQCVELSTEETKKIIDEYSALGISGLTFTGGEPLLRKDIFELIKHAKGKNLIVHLNTNGYLLDEEYTEKLFDTGIDSVSLSLDSADLEKNDSIRGHEGAYNKTIRAINNLILYRNKSAKYIRIKVLTVVSELNIDAINDVVRFLDNLGVDSIEVVPMQAFKEADRQDKALCNEVTAAKIKKVANDLMSLKKQSNKIEDSAEYIGLFNDSFSGKKSPVKCYVGYHGLQVDCYGDYYPCLYWFHLGRSIGNVKDIGLKEFWYSKKYNEIRNEISECRECYVSCHTELSILFNGRGN